MDGADYIVVGAGSAGCAIAAGLSADPRRRVLVIEAGGSDRRFWIRTPIGYGKTFFDPAVNWMYRTEPEAALGGREGYWPRGKVLGGSSSINAMVWCRGLPADYDDWRDAGNPGWGWDEVGPAFRRIERRAGPAGETGDGPLWVSDRAAEYHPVTRRFLAAAREAGLPATADMNGDAPEGVGAYAVTTRRGLRCSAADAYLRPAMGRANLKVMTGAAVERVVFEGRRAVGVAVRLPGGAAAVLRAAAEVILAAGAIGSPQILQLSGVGPGQVLGRAGVPVVHANAAVGGGMQDHLGVNYYFRATEPTLNQVLGTWAGRMAAGVRFLATRTGPLSLSVNQMGGMVRSRPEAPRPDMQLYFNPLSYHRAEGGRRELLLPDPFPGFILGFNPCRPTSRGRTDIVSPDPKAAPEIRPNSLSTEGDVAQVVAGGRLVGRLGATAALGALIAEWRGIDLRRAGDEEIVEDFRARASTVFHPCGTCRMAPEEAGGVVDARLRVHGVAGLRVADASVFPNVTSANTNAPAIMVGVRAAELIAAEYSC